MRILLILLYREIDLVPLIRLRQIAGHIRSDILPNPAILRTLYGEREVRAGLVFFVAGISDEGGEVHLLSFAKSGIHAERSYLTRGRHTVAEDHISFFGTSVLLHFMPEFTEIRNTVDEVVLTHVRQVLQAALVMRTVIGKSCRLRIRKAVGCVRPRQRMRINRIGASGLVVVEIQALHHVKVFLYLRIGDDGFIYTVYFLLQFRTKTLLTMVNNRVTAYIEPIVTRHRNRVEIHTTVCQRFLASCAQTIYYGIGILSGRHTRLFRHVQEVICLCNGVFTCIVCLRLGVIGVPLAWGIPAAAPDHRVLTGVIPSGRGPVIIPHIVAQERLRVLPFLDIVIVITLLCLQKQAVI